MKSLCFFALLWTITAFHYLVLLWERFYMWISGGTYTSHHAHALAIRWGKALFKYTPGWHIDIEGQAHIPSYNKSYIIVANHESATDILAVYLLGINFRWLSKSSIFRLPLLGRAMRWAGYIPIERGNRHSHVLALQQSAACIKQGVPVLFFPEGTRSVLGHPKEFKTGAFRLAQDLNVGVLPIVLYGAGKLLKRRSLAPHAATISVLVLPMTHPQPEETSETFTRRVEHMIKHAHMRLKQEQGIYGSSTTAQAPHPSRSH
jgi:1-acyl-sn-glycerol-3-phosphate acyltransferase